MSTIAKSNQAVLVGHVCSKCGAPLVMTVNLYAEGAANVFFHEKEKAQEACEKAREQAMKDIVECYATPRNLGSFTDVPTESNRIRSIYRFEMLDSPCPKCQHVELWQQGKKSMWDPMDGSFKSRRPYPDIPQVSRPVVLNGKQDIDMWMRDPLCKAPRMERPVVVKPVENDWVCAKCGAANMARVQNCQGCGVTKQWSDAKRAKKAK